MKLDDSFLIPDEQPDFKKCQLEEVHLDQLDLSIPDEVEAGDPIRLYMEEIKELPHLAESEEKILIEKLEQGDIQASKRLTEAYLPLVVSITKEYLGLGMQFSDLIQEGSMGLMSAVEQYGTDLGCEFGGYAAWWIRQSIRKGLEENGEISHISTYMADTVNKLMDASKAFVEQNGRTPDPEELADAVDMPLGRVREILEVAREASQDEEKEEKEETVSDAELENDNSKVIEEAARRAILKEKVDELLGKLSEDERKVLRLRYGLDDGKAQSARDVGEEMGYTEEEITSIEAGALKKLSNSEKN